MDLSKFTVCPDTGYTVGYHVTTNPLQDFNGDTESPSILFIGHDVMSWYPDHLPQEELSGYLVYRVLVDVKASLVFKEQLENHFSSPYFSLFNTEYNRDSESESLCYKSTKHSELFKHLESIGVNFISLVCSKELSEGFVLNPSISVKSIEIIDMDKLGVSVNE